ncbi:MAG TPA: O-methyltransferase [Lachnospiraceae bacterium]|nr:O-methyltransferase [Lachnospiraceae bacterium]
MIYSERLRVFLHAMEQPDEYFDSLRAQAQEAGIPIIRKEMERFLQVLLELKKPDRILEVGTATGYSALWMASVTPKQVKITTIEKDALRAGKARRAFERSEWGGRISLLEADAADALAALPDQAYDFIFMDAAKAQYIAFLPQVLRVLCPGGVLVSDNVLQDGVILEPHTALAHRDRTIHTRMREYLRALKKDERLITSIVPIGDGAAVTMLLH